MGYGQSHPMMVMIMIIPISAKKRIQYSDIELGQ